MALAATLAMFAGGCEKPQPRLTCHVASRAELSRLGRVVLVNLQDEAAQPEIAAQMTDALYRALQDRQIFHMETLRPEQPPVPLLRKGCQGPYTLEEVAELRETLQADAVLLGSVTSFQQHPRMQVGLVLRLVDLKNATTPWSVDLVWDTRDKTVQAALERYFKAHVAQEYKPLGWQIGTVSPDVFLKFVAYEVSCTLPDGGAARGRAK
jgi:hypothetical protein